ncbi:histidine kinase dimerization/phospho-acceptor domain-containing protein [Mycetocola zhadangensis]|uniref:histidine kinase dimerization/phospho-acceptor domain-containing protein n=1 Tax=Mycetocola zhadangensis TaxID=1164595 RepID=UPI003A4DDED4
MAVASRSWSPTEVGVLQHAGLTTSVSLLHSSMIASREKAVRSATHMDQASCDAISTISQELRTPLTSVTGYLSLLRDEDGLPDYAQPIVDVGSLAPTVADDLHETARRKNLTYTVGGRRRSCGWCPDLGRWCPAEESAQLPSPQRNQIYSCWRRGRHLVEKDTDGCHVAARDSGIGILQTKYPASSMIFIARRTRS